MDGDEQEARIAALFREAASGAPPPGFDAAQVAATSRRITRRRRSVVAGAALAVLAVVGVGAVAGLGGPGEATVTVASGQAAGQAADQNENSAGGAGDAARAAAPEAAAAPDAGGAPLAAPGVVPAPGSAAAAVPRIGTPLGPGPTDRCADRQDPALRALVEQVLPEVATATEGPVTLDCSVAGDRGVSLEVHDGTSTGVLVVRYFPAGADTGTEGQRAPTASGGTVVAYSWASRAGAPAPFADRIGDVVAYLAPRL